MLGQPKYKREERVKFETEIEREKKLIDGVIYVVDPYGSKESQEEPSYDIETYLDGEVLLFKHIPESCVFKR